MLPFWLSIAVLSLAQGALVAVPGTVALPGFLSARGRLWALIPPLSVVGFVLITTAAQRASSQGLTYLALVAVPPLAALALGALSHGSRPALAWVVLPLFVLAWADRGGLAGNTAALILSALSCVTLGVLLAALTPPIWLGVGIIAMAVVDTALVVSDLLQRPNNALNAAHPALRLPRLQSEVFGSAVMGYGDIFIAALLGGLLVASMGRSAQRMGAVLTAALRARAGPAVLLRRRAAGDGARGARDDRCRCCSGAAREARGIDAIGSPATWCRSGTCSRCAVIARAVISIAAGESTSRSEATPGLLDPADLRDHAVVEGADRLVVGADGGVELASRPSPGADEAAEPAVQLARRLRDLARRLGDQLLAPAIVDRPQQTDERRRRGHQHLLLDAVLDQRRILRQRRLVDAVGGHEHDDELRGRVELAAGSPWRRAW